MTEGRLVLFDVSSDSPGDVPAPPVPDVTTGIWISAPRVVSFETDAEPRLTGYVPVALSYQFTVAFLRRFHYVAAHISVCATEAKTGRTYCGSLQEDDADLEVPEPPNPGDERVLASRQIQFNLAHFVALPAREATYHVHVQIENHQSNVVTIEVVREKR